MRSLMAGRPVPYVLPNILDRTFLPGEPNRDIGRCQIRTDPSDFHPGLHHRAPPAAPPLVSISVTKRLFPEHGALTTHVPPGVIHHHLGWPQNHGVIASRDPATTAPADARGAFPALSRPELSRLLGRTISAPWTACVAAWPALVSWKPSRPSAFLVRLPRVVEPPPAMRPHGR